MVPGNRDTITHIFHVLFIKQWWNIGNRKKLISTGSTTIKKTNTWYQGTETLLHIYAMCYLYSSDGTLAIEKS